MNQVTCSFRTVMASEIAALTELFKQQMEASAQREKRMAEILDQTLKTVALAPQPAQAATQAGASLIQQPVPQSAKTVHVAVDRPMLLSSATAADFTAWEEAWHDFSCCQKLSCQDKQTRASTIRQCLDEDLRRFLREDTISVPADPDASDIIDAVRTFIRRQRNPLLDRISFYNRQQHRGELFDSFFTSLKELYHACNFTNTKLCDDCNTHACRGCKTKLSQQQDEIMRDRLVVGISDDETRHKLLAISDLTLAEAVKICRAEEAAVHSGQHIPSTHTSTINAARKSQSLRFQASGDAEI